MAKPDKTLTKPDIGRTKPDFYRTNQDKISRCPRSNVPKCPVLSAFPGNAPSLTAGGEGLTDSHRSAQIIIDMNDDCSVKVQKVAFSADALDDPTQDDDGGTEASVKEDGSSTTSHSGYGIGATSQEFRRGARSSLQDFTRLHGH